MSRPSGVGCSCENYSNWPSPPPLWILPSRFWPLRIPLASLLTRPCVSRRWCLNTAPVIVNLLCWEGSVLGPRSPPCGHTRKALCRKGHSDGTKGDSCGACVGEGGTGAQRQEGSAHGEAGRGVSWVWRLPSFFAGPPPCSQPLGCVLV